jgi:hypothetical protein
VATERFSLAQGRVKCQASVLCDIHCYERFSLNHTWWNWRFQTKRLHKTLYLDFDKFNQNYVVSISHYIGSRLILSKGGRGSKLDVSTATLLYEEFQLKLTVTCPRTPKAAVWPMTSTSSQIHSFRYGGPSTHKLIVYWPAARPSVMRQADMKVCIRTWEVTIQACKYMNKGAANWALKVLSRQISYWLIGYVAVEEVLRKARLSFSQAKCRVFRVTLQCGFAGEEARSVC